MCNADLDGHYFHCSFFMNITLLTPEYNLSLKVFQPLRQISFALSIAEQLAMQESGKKLVEEFINPNSNKWNK